MAEGPSGSPGISKMARVISQRAAKVAEKAERDLVLDFGQIQGDMSLLTNTFPIPIPREDYHVCSLMGFPAERTEGTKAEMVPTATQRSRRRSRLVTGCLWRGYRTRQL